jgi:hypothetical protein
MATSAGSTQKRSSATSDGHAAALLQQQDSPSFGEFGYNVMFLESLIMCAIQFY